MMISQVSCSGGVIVKTWGVVISSSEMVIAVRSATTIVIGGDGEGIRFQRKKHQWMTQNRRHLGLSTDKRH